jgi:hypothetical protein
MRTWPRNCENIRWTRILWPQKFRQCKKILGERKSELQNSPRHPEIHLTTTEHNIMEYGLGVCQACEKVTYQK